MNEMTRRSFLQRAGAAGLLATLGRVSPAIGQVDAASAARPKPTGDGPAIPLERDVIDLTIDHVTQRVGGRAGRGVGVNGSIPGPLVRLREGQGAIIRVTNRLEEISSIHWHGLIVPPEMDGVPGVSFPGIPPEATFTYRFPVRQSGTYWAHSHSGGQELLGLYFPLIIDPAEPEPFSYDRDHVVMLSDWSFERPETIVAKLKKQAGYYNFQRRTLGDFARDARTNGWIATLRERLSWSKMRMDPTDFADVTGYTYTYLMNGHTADANWSGRFDPGQTVRLRFIDAAAMTYFDVRIPGLRMTVVQVDGQNVKPVEVDEFRVGPGETIDVIVRPDDLAYTIFAEALDRSGYVRGTLAPRAGMAASIPPRRPRPLRTMKDMGMEMPNMESGRRGTSRVSEHPKPGVVPVDSLGSKAPTAGHQAHGASAGPDPNARAETNPRRGSTSNTEMKGMEMPGSAESRLQGPSLPGSPPVMHGRDTHGPGSSSVAMAAYSRLDDPGSGFEQTDGRVLVYADLESLAPQPDSREPEREVELHITGNMERYSWSFDGKKYSEAKDPIRFRYGERLRVILVNDTMMEHPIHLHGMWMELENGAGTNQPRKHTVTVKPAERLTVAITADAPGLWAMHCHLLLHMEMGMFRVVEVVPADERKP